MNKLQSYSGAHKHSKQIFEQKIKHSVKDNNNNNNNNDDGNKKNMLYAYDLYDDRPKCRRMQKGIKRHVYAHINVQ